MKKVNKPRIIERLRAKYALTDVEKEIFRLEEVINLVENVGELVKDYDVFVEPNFSRLGASGVGWATMLTVTSGKRYSLRALRAERVSGDGTLTLIQATDKGGNGVRIYSQTASATVFTLILTQDIILEELRMLYVYVSAITTDSLWAMSWYGSKEDAF